MAGEHQEADTEQANAGASVRNLFDESAEPLASAAAPTTSPATIAVANIIVGPDHLAQWIRQSFVDTLDTLDEVCGVREFYLRRLLAPGLDHCVFASITTWPRLDDFEAWRTSTTFVHAHPDRGRYRKEFRQLRSIRLDLSLNTRSTIADLDAAILSRLAAEHPDVVAAGAGTFASQLHWETAQLTWLSRQRT
ncbi:hypothetical protein [Nocardia nova]|uniref:hypothetical protein n=1 Tax=Nocardia nova TaxID=37330 RepID=UPI0033C22613